MQSIHAQQNQVPIELLGFRMYLNPEDQGVSGTLLRERVWEALETELVKDEVHAGDAVLDIGANIGYYTLLFARIVGAKGRVLAFEPDPINFSLLERNIALNECSNVTLVQKAVSNSTGETVLYLSKENKGDHRIYKCSGEDRDCVAIKVIRLDDFFEGAREKIDFVKLDIQGSEYAALEGMVQVLERNRDVKILTEFWPAGLRRFGTEPDEYLGLLLSHGFKLYHVDYEERVQRTSVSQLLSKYGGDSEDYTTLFCTRNDWQREHAYNTLGERLYRVQCEIAGLIPTGYSFILVDEEAWGAADLLPDRQCIPFLERDGRYWGVPADDETAIREFERLRQSGASFMVFAWPAFWWLEYYSGLNHHLRSNFRCVLENERVVMFDLRM